MSCSFKVKIIPEHKIYGFRDEPYMLKQYTKEYYACGLTGLRNDECVGENKCSIINKKVKQ